MIDIISLYRKRAKYYDLTANLYTLLGFPENRYRKMAVQELGLEPGGIVVEIGCGTGLNFHFLEDAVGPTGRIIGVDVTDAMLEVARKRVIENGWKNVELVQRDVAKFNFPPELDGILSTFALTLVPDYERVLQNGAAALAPGKRWVSLDLKPPRQAPPWVNRLMNRLIRPFVVSNEYLTRQPWEAMQKQFKNTRLAELFLGFAYIAIGEKGE